MLNVFHKGLYRGAAVAVMPCYNVVDRVSLRFSLMWAHVLILLSLSVKIFPCLEWRAPLRRLNQSGIKSAICPCETSSRGLAIVPLSSSTVTA